MRKPILPLIISLFLLEFTGIAHAAPSVNLNGRILAFDVSPAIENGRTLVPLRAIFEALGATVQWDSGTRTIIAEKGNTTVKLTIDDRTASKNGSLVVLDVPPKIIEGRTMVPLRFVGEAFDCQVSWDPQTQTVNITSTPATTQSGSAAILTGPAGILYRTSDDYHENKAGKYAVKYPVGFTIKDDINEKLCTTSIQDQPVDSSTTAGLIFYGESIEHLELLNVDKVCNMALDKINTDGPAKFQNWAENSRSKITLSSGETAWLSKGNAIIDNQTFTMYILTTCGNNNTLLIGSAIWPDSWDLPGNQEAFKYFLSSVKFTQ